MVAAAAMRFAIPRLPRRARVVLLTVHVAMSAGWFGLLSALVALEVAELCTGEPAQRPGIAAAMAVIACWVLTPVVFVAVFSGVVLAMFTQWGLVRHWWVIAKCGIAFVLTASGAVLMLPQLPAIISGEGEDAGMQSLIARCVAIVLLLVATGLSVVKPWGKTPHGRRIHRASPRRPPLHAVTDTPARTPIERVTARPPPERLPIEPGAHRYQAPPPCPHPVSQTSQSPAQQK
jgi:hypothetical protein